MTLTNKALVLYFDPAIEYLKAKIERDVIVLNALEKQYLNSRNMIDVFKLQKSILVRDKLEEHKIRQLTLNYLELFFNTLLSNNVEAIDKIVEEYLQNLKQLKLFQKNSSISTSCKSDVTQDEMEEISFLWKSLVKIFHPDKYSNVNKRSACQRISSLINDARDELNIDLLREIALDPEAFLLRKEWSLLSHTETFSIIRLENIYSAIGFQILKYNELIDKISFEPEYRMSQISAKVPNYLENITKQFNDEKNIEISIIIEQCENIMFQISKLQDGKFAKQAGFINPDRL